MLVVKGNMGKKTKYQKNLGAIVAYLREHGYVSNNQVEKICRVKDRTAFKYLQELERIGTILQLGKTGQSVW